MLNGRMRILIFVVCDAHIVRTDHHDRDIRRKIIDARIKRRKEIAHFQPGNRKILDENIFIGRKEPLHDATVAHAVARDGIAEISDTEFFFRIHLGCAASIFSRLHFSKPSSTPSI